jgi:hypothetical protein
MRRRWRRLKRTMSKIPHYVATPFARRRADEHRAEAMATATM